MQHYLDVTDPDLCVLEMDIYWAHVAQHQWRWRYDWEATGSRTSSTRWRRSRSNKRYALFHAKDGDRTTDPPGVGNGYDFIPFGDPRSDIDFEEFFATWAPRATTTRTTSRTTRRADSRPGPVAALLQVQRLQHGQLRG